MSDQERIAVIRRTIADVMKLSPVNACTWGHEADIEFLLERYDALTAENARLRKLIESPPRHMFWGVGEPDCPREIKAGNGDLHTLRCKVCGKDNPRNEMCLSALGEP